MLAMQQDIHPQYHHDTKVICACGNEFTTGSTLKEIRVEICSQCHPFFTGEKKLVDSEGRVERFERKRRAAQAQKAKSSAPQKTPTDSPSATPSGKTTDQDNQEEE